MNDGDRRFLAKDYAGALSAYQGAHAIMGVPTTGTAVARSLAALGQLVEARDAAVLVTRRPAQPNEPAPFVRAREAADQLAKDLAGRIPSVQITVAGPPSSSEIRVTFDNEPVPQAVLKLPLKTDPGNHVVHASSTGFTDGSSTFSLKEGENATVVVKLDPSPVAPVAEAPPATPNELPTAPTPEAPRRLSPLVFVGFGVGAAGLVTGAVAGLAHLTQISDVKSDYCNGTTVCREGYQSAVDHAGPTATVSDIGFVVAGAGIAAGVVGLVLSARRAAPAREEGAAASVQPIFGVGSVGVKGRF
jgi:hypothetical protein